MSPDTPSSSGGRRWPQSSAGLVEGTSGGGSDQKRMNKKKKKKSKQNRHRQSIDSNELSTVALSRSGGDHDTSNGVAHQQHPAIADQSNGETPASSATRGKLKFGDGKAELVGLRGDTSGKAVGAPVVSGGRLGDRGSLGDDGGVDMGDDNDEGVVVQREILSNNSHRDGGGGAKKKQKRGVVGEAVAAAVEQSSATSAAAVIDKFPMVVSDEGLNGDDTSGLDGTDTSSTKKTKKKRRKRSWELGAASDDSSGIPFALPKTTNKPAPRKNRDSSDDTALTKSTATCTATTSGASSHVMGGTPVVTSKQKRADHPHTTTARSVESAKRPPGAGSLPPRDLLPNGIGRAAGVAEDSGGAGLSSSGRGAGYAGDSGSVSGNGVGVGVGRKRSRGDVNGTAPVGDKQGNRGLPRMHQEQRKGLPIFAHRAGIIRAVKEHQTVVVVGETGSGKSTQIPQFLYEAGICGGGAGWNNAAGQHAGAKGGGKERGRAAADNGVLKGGGRGWGGARGVIACTQPRRVAAVTVAKRVASEAGSELGNVVGYTVRFDDRTSKSTRIKYMTDGVLLREAMGDPLLSAYSAIILDEAHERSLDTDILFGLVRRLQPRRPDLKVVVMSATLDVDLFQRFFRDSVSLHVPGRTHAVDVMYAKESQEDYLDACLLTCLQIHEEEEGYGDVLVFLPGQDDIEALAQLLRESLAVLRAEKSREVAALAAEANDATGLGEFHASGEGGVLEGKGLGLLRESMVCPVFAALPQEQQLEAFEPAPEGTRKFVLATNIAETSITINGIRYVVDSGKVKVRSFQPATGMEFLRSQDVSKAQATQRAGRAGREAPGVCFRLYREDDYIELGDTPTPEILRVNLAQVVLQLKVMGIEDPSTFDYVTAPRAEALVKAFKTLVILGALDHRGRVTADGKKMAALPLDPAFAHLVIRSVEPRFACTKEVLTTVACLSAENLFFFPSKEEAKQAARESHRAFAAYEGDLPTLLRVYEGFLKGRKDPTWCRRNFVNGRSVARAVDVRQQLAKILRERLRIDPEESCGAEMSQYLRCLVSGLFTNVAVRQPAAKGVGGRGNYRTAVGGREVQIHPSSSLAGRNPPAKCVVFTELICTSRDFIKTVTAVDASWLRELVPKYFGARSTVQ